MYLRTTAVGYCVFVALWFASSERSCALDAAAQPERDFYVSAGLHTRGGICHRALLTARLHDAAVRARRGDHCLAFSNRERQRLFAVHIFACAASSDRGESMPMVGRADDDRIDVLAVEPFAVVAVASGCLLRQPFDTLELLSEMAGVDVAQCDDIHPVELFQERTNVLSAAIADAERATKRRFNLPVRDCQRESSESRTTEVRRCQQSAIAFARGGNLN